MLNLSRRVILASGSPRRKELLQELVLTFEIIVSDVDEESLMTADVEQTVERLAEAKARAVYQNNQDALVIGGDTVVVLNDAMLNKPKSVDEAKSMLRSLSGQTHLVRTGVCLATSESVQTFSDVTRVTFRAISDQEIDNYVATGEPMDKAGAYAIQGGAAPFVEAIEGSLSNVIGLPLEKLRAHLMNNAMNGRNRSSEE